MGSKLRCLIYKSIFAFKYYQNFIIWFKTQLTLMPRAPISPKLFGGSPSKDNFGTAQNNRPKNIRYFGPTKGHGIRYLKVLT